MKGIEKVKKKYILRDLVYSNSINAIWIFCLCCVLVWPDPKITSCFQYLVQRWCLLFLLTRKKKVCKNVLIISLNVLFQVEPFDGLPQLICAKCKEILNKFHTIKITFCKKQANLRNNVIKKDVSTYKPVIDKQGFGCGPLMIIIPHSICFSPYLSI